jgi:uncharacterized protein (DUF1778 family)
MRRSKQRSSRPAVQRKSERLQVRLDAPAKRMLERAASYRHESISEFVLGTALEEAERIVQRSEVVTLTDRDWAQFFEALENPPAPNATLQRAFERYKKATG